MEEGGERTRQRSGQGGGLRGVRETLGKTRTSAKTERAFGTIMEYEVPAVMSKLGTDPVATVTFHSDEFVEVPRKLPSRS